MAGRILIIDDEDFIRSFMKDFFEDRGYNVDTAEDGVEGVEKFTKGTYDLVMTDMMMPKMLGLEVLRRVREIKPDQKMIMMTGVKEASMVEKAKALGCQHYLTKPVQLAELEARVAECFPPKAP